MDNRERSRRDFSLGFTVPTVVLPNMIKVSEEDDSTVSDASPQEPAAPRPRRATLDQERPEDPPQPSQVADEAGIRTPGQVWFHATATQEMTIVGDDGQTVHVVPESHTVRVFLPVTNEDGVQWATVHAFTNDLGSIATGRAVVADSDGYKVGSLSL